MFLATAAEVGSTIGYIILAVLALMVMVVIHELGHYTAGKILGFKILEFGIGFGPKIFKRTGKKTGEVFSIGIIPLGGFCQFEDEDEKSNSPTAFNNQAPWKRIIVLFAGAFMNLVSAWVIITLVFTFYGQVLPSVQRFYNDSANIESGLTVGDTILSIDGKQVNILTSDDLTNLFNTSGDTAKVTVQRGEKKVTVTLTKSNYVLGSFDADGNFTPTLDQNGEKQMKYGFGFVSSVSAVKLPFFRALGRSFSFMFYLVYQILAILGKLFTGKIGMENAGGPITTIVEMSNASRGGLATLSYVVCLISANLAVMNLLPLPALDGSRIVFCLIEWIFKKPVNKKVEAIIHTVGFVLIFAFAIFADVFRFIKLR